MAAAKPGNAHPASRPNPVPRDRLIHIGRTGWQVPAMVPGNRGQSELIGAYGNMRGNPPDGRQM